MNYFMRYKVGVVIYYSKPAEKFTMSRSDPRIAIAMNEKTG